MSTNVTLNSVVYPIPALGESGWATNVSNYLIAISTGLLSKAGGSFTLTAEVDFGTTFGVKSAYFKSRGIVSAAGIFRLANGESVTWRNFANSADVFLSMNSQNVLSFGGQPLLNISIGAAYTALAMNSSGTAYSFYLLDNNNIATAAAIAYSKLALTGSILNTDLAGSIALSKLAALSTSRVVVTDGTGLMTTSSTTATDLGFIGGLSSSAQSQITNNLATLAFHTASSANIHGVTGGIVGTTDTQTMTNKNLSSSTNSVSGATASSFTNSGTVTMPTGPETLVGRATTDTLLNKTVVSSTAAITGALTLPSGSVAQRPTAVAGMTRLNTDANEFEGYSNGAWQSIGGGLNEQPVKNYLKSFAAASIAPGTLSTVAVGGNITITSGTSAFFADVTSGAAALTQSTSTLLRGAFNYLTAVSGASLTGSVFVQLPAMTLESADAGKPISISFDTTGNTLDGDWDVVVAWYNSTGVFQGLIPIAGNASACSSTASAKLPTGTAVFNGFFIPTSTAGDTFSLRLRRLAGTVQIRVDTLMVGNVPVRVGAAVTDSVSYPTTLTNFGNGTAALSYSRSGAFIIIEGTLVVGSSLPTGSIKFSLPVGLNASYSNIPIGITGGDSYQFVGSANLFKSPTHYAGQILRDSTSTTTFFIVGPTDWNATVPTTLSAGNAFGVYVVVPISNWSSNSQMADRALSEYAYNTDTSDAANTTSFGNGSSGVQFGSFTVQRQKRVRFQTPKQPTDKIFLEFTLDSGTTWQEVSNSTSAVIPYQGQTTNVYGMGWESVIGNSTDVDVYFATYRGLSAGVYGAAGNAWSGVAGSNQYRWRVAKYSAGGQMAGPISTSNIVGRVDGSVVGSGYIGESLSQQRTRGVALALTTAVLNDATATALTLTPGVWSITASVGFTGSATSVVLECFVGTASGTGAGGFDNADGYFITPAVTIAATDYIASLPPVIKNISASTPYYLKVRGAFASGVVNAFGTIKAIRIA